MQLETVGHAGALLRDDQGAPLLFTDPWVIGSCYWRSWWLQHYPDEALLSDLRQVPYCYITHEHPDHFHTASIRALGQGTHYLAPDLPGGRIAEFLASRGHRVSVLPAFRWVSLGQGVSVLSIPLLNDDSILLVDTPHAVIVNLNDSKPRAAQLDTLAAALDTVAAGKRRVLLSSYSPASIVNSFLRGASRVSLRQKTSYVHAVSEVTRRLSIDCFMPFASQVIFKRSDSAWANEFKVSFEDLRRHWTGAPDALLPPYTCLDLERGTHTTVPPEQYRHDDATMRPKIEAQEALDESVEFTEDDLGRLRAMLAHGRWLLGPLFPRGIGFSLDRTELHYSPWSGTLTRARSTGDFVLRVPTQAFREAVEFGHFGDLGTTMFTMVQLNSDIHPRRVYAFFLLMTLHDYGHTTSVSNWLRWVGRTIRIHRWRVPAVPVNAEPVRG